MIEIFKRNPVAVVIALVMHLVIVLFMLVGVDWLKKPQQPTSVVEVVQARVVDHAKVAAEVEKLKQAEAAKKKTHDAAKSKQEQQLAELKKKQKKEKKRLADLEKKRKQLEAKEQTAIDAAKKRQVKEQVAIDEAKKRKAKKQAAIDAAKKLKAKKQAAIDAAKKLKAKKQAAIDAAKKRKVKEQAAIDAAKKLKAKKQAAIDVAKKRKAKEQAEKDAAEKALQDKMREEQFAREGMSVMAAIKNKVNDNWVYMPGAVEKGLKCAVRVRLGSNGTVLLANVVKSSGDAAFDRSVETAVWKSEPLPMPTTPELRNHPDFREHTFVFDPSQSR